MLPLHVYFGFILTFDPVLYIFKQVCYVDILLFGQRNARMFPHEKQIFSIYTNKYFPGETIKMPKLDNYSGAEIRQTVIEAAYNGGDFEKATEFVVPLYRSHADSIKMLRDRAAKCWVSASKKAPSIEERMGATVRRLDA